MFLTCETHMSSQKPPLLSPSVMEEKLHLYLVVSNTAVSSVLIREKENFQKPDYCNSQAFQREKANYPRMEKIAFALLVASKKLRPYFQAHSIVVMTDQPIRKMMNKIDAAGRLIQLAIELGQFNIEYWPRAAIKAQVLADFIAEFTYPYKEKELPMETWTVQTDGSTMKKVGGAGVVLISLENEMLKYAVRLQFSATNNEVEYEALQTGLSLAKALGAKNLIVQADSQQIIGQVKGDYEAKEKRMQKYLKIVQQLLQHFDSLDLCKSLGPKTQKLTS